MVTELNETKILALIFFTSSIYYLLICYLNFFAYSVFVKFHAHSFSDVFSKKVRKV
jgi:hypothetical protein